MHYAEYADCDNNAATGLGNGCHEVMYSTDYTDDVNSATWVVIYNDTFDNYNVDIVTANVVTTSSGIGFTGNLVGDVNSASISW